MYGMAKKQLVDVEIMYKRVVKQFPILQSYFHSQTLVMRKNVTMCATKTMVVLANFSFISDKRTFAKFTATN